MLYASDMQAIRREWVNALRRPSNLTVGNVGQLLQSMDLSRESAVIHSAAEENDSPNEDARSDVSDLSKPDILETLKTLQEREIMLYDAFQQLIEALKLRSRLIIIIRMS